MARPRDTDGGGGLQIWRVTRNILNKQSPTADKMWSSSLGVGRRVNNSSPLKTDLLRNVAQGLALQTLMNTLMNLRVP
jgi:hypothetical protein